MSPSQNYFYNSGFLPCIGCGRCVVACPYKARNMDSGTFYTEGTPRVEEYEKAPTWEYNK
ncbi:MAG: 4Fe-4S dicluster domain-containing protein, partial [Deltaproteobacteria bacterium]|nr:4Fe-4S dicluster domain-containing protein [Deltaproteobacteria bacterium]